MELSSLFIAVLTAGLGFIAGYLIGFRKNKHQQQFEMARTELEQARASLEVERSQVNAAQARIDELKSELQEIRTQLGEATAKAARLESAKEAAEKQIEMQSKDLVRIQETLRKDFELLANKIFTEKSEKFTQHSRSSIDQVLEPLKLRLKEFQDKVELTHKESLLQANSLKEEIKHLRDTGAQMSREAENLAKALKNDSKIQGNWGEMILESILEASGLVKNREYFIQQNFTNDDGKRLQPDVVVKLPDNKWVVIDSKVSLTAYERFVHAEDDKSRDDSLKAHVISLRNHIKGLLGKKYQEVGDGHNLDFILMFIPVESAYLTALNSSPDLFNEAYDRGIILVCPSTLIASLKIIAATWKHEYQNKNALDIAQRGKLLLDKFVNFVDDLEKVGIHIERTQGAYTDAMNKLSKGKGNLMTQAKTLEELGVKATKQLSEL